MMIKWFCDVCDKEIEAPEHPTRVKTERTATMRPSGQDSTIIESWAHQKCGDILESEIKSALINARRLVNNNA